MSRSERWIRITGLILVLLVSISATLAALPPGFQESVVFSGITKPTDLDFDPDGGIWAIGMEGEVWVIRNLVGTLALSIPVGLGGELGLTGLAIDPDYANNGHVWLYYTVPGGASNRLARFTNVNDVLTNETTIVEIPNISPAYSGGCLAFFSDGTVLLGTGFDGDNDSARDPFSLKAKILRMNPDGSPAADNPFILGTQADPRVYAMGFRNPFRCVLKPGTDTLFIADVGFATWEEIDILVPGAHYGWPDVEGPAPPGQPLVTYPWYSYLHPSTSNVSAIIGGDFAEAGDFAPVYEGDYFFADFNNRFLFRVRMDTNNNILSVEQFATNIFGPASMKFGPDGKLYLVSWQYNQIRNIHFVGGVSGGQASNLILNKTAAFELELSWASSCQPGDIDYAVFEGPLSDLRSAVPRVCSTDGFSTHTLTPSLYSAFYLVAPTDQLTQGSVGADSNGNERPLSLTCLSKSINACP